MIGCLFDVTMDALLCRGMSAPDVKHIVICNLIIVYSADERGEGEG